LVDISSPDKLSKETPPEGLISGEAQGQLNLPDANSGRRVSEMTLD